VTPQAVGELVDDLERFGCVRRLPDRRDRRAKLIVPTAAGYGCVQAAFDRIGRIERRLEQLIGPRELDDLRRFFSGSRGEAIARTSHRAPRPRPRRTSPNDGR
jgi:DNA-binding MarR family transcriptional regulator